MDIIDDNAKSKHGCNMLQPLWFTIMTFLWILVGLCWIWMDLIVFSSVFCLNCQFWSILPLRCLDFSPFRIVRPFHSSPRPWTSTRQPLEPQSISTRKHALSKRWSHVAIPCQWKSGKASKQLSQQSKGLSNSIFFIGTSHLSHLPAPQSTKQRSKQGIKLMSVTLWRF